MHPGEQWQDYDYNGERRGAIDSDHPDAHPTHLFGGTAIMLYRYQDGQVEFLFQHRSSLVDRNPDKWDVSAGGHVNFEEPLLTAAAREAQEEIGAELDPSHLEFSAAYVRRHKALVHLFFYDWTGNEDHFHFDDHEVSEVKWVPFDDLVAFWPELKSSVQDDAIFQALLLEQTRTILDKYGNIDK